MNIKKIFISLESVLSSIYSVILKIDIVLMIVWPIVIFVYVVLRYIGVVWLFVEEYTLYWLVIISFTTFAYALRVGKHVQVDIFIKKFPEKIRKLLEIIADFIMIFITIYFLHRSWRWFLYGFKLKLVSTYMSCTMLWPFYLIVVIGLGLLVGEVFLKTYWDFEKLKIKELEESKFPVKSGQ